MSKCYIFGVENGREKIIQFDVATLKFEEIPKPKDLTLWNYSSSIFLTKNQIFITGGISEDLQNITNESYI